MPLSYHCFEARSQSSYSGDDEVEEEEGGNELGYEGSVEGLELELAQVEEWCWWRVHIVLAMAQPFFVFKEKRHFSNLTLPKRRNNEFFILFDGNDQRSGQIAIC